VKAAFESWIALPDATGTHVCAKLSTTRAAELVVAASTEAAFIAWQRVRRSVRWSREAGRPAGATPRDGHVTTSRRGMPRGKPVRADRPREALSTIRPAARAGEPLTMALLARWHHVVLGLDAGPAFHTCDPCAKGGRERHSIGPHVAPDFDACLLEAGGPPRLAPALAARVYLDAASFTTSKTAPRGRRASRSTMCSRARASRSPSPIPCSPSPAEPTNWA
jgi:hypothetical protein